MTHDYSAFNDTQVKCNSIETSNKNILPLSIGSKEGYLPSKIGINLLEKFDDECIHNNKSAHLNDNTADYVA